MTIDSRILTPGLEVSLEQLARVFADHFPGSRVRRRGASAPVIAERCPECGAVLTAAAPECPTMRVVRPLLAQRRHENPHTVGRVLTDAQQEDLSHVQSAPIRKPAQRRRPAAESLFDPEPYRVRPTTRI